MAASTDLSAVLAAFARYPRVPEGGYGPEVHAAVAGYAASLRREGKPWAVIARGLPISANTTRAWTLAAETTGTRLVPVAVTEPPPPPADPIRLVLVTPGGYRLEGLDAATAYQLLRGLG